MLGTCVSCKQWRRIVSWNSGKENLLCQHCLEAELRESREAARAAAARRVRLKHPPVKAIVLEQGMVLLRYDGPPQRLTIRGEEFVVCG